MSANVATKVVHVHLLYMIVFELRGTRRNQFRRGQDHGAAMVSTARITQPGVVKSPRGHRGRVRAEWGGRGTRMTCVGRR